MLLDAHKQNTPINGKSTSATSRSNFYQNYSFDAFEFCHPSFQKSYLFLLTKDITLLHLSPTFYSEASWSQTNIYRQL